MIDRLVIGARSDDLKIGWVTWPFIAAGQEQHSAGIDVRSFEQTVEREMCDARNIGLAGEFEREPAEFRRGLADARNRQIARLSWPEVARLIPAMCDVRRLIDFVN